MKISTQYNSDYEYTATTEEGQSVKIDMKAEGKTDMSPMQLVLSALTACVAVEVALTMKKKRRQVVDLKIEGEGNRQESHPKYFTNIHLTFTLVSPDATLEELNKVIALAVDSYCSVGSSLNADITHEGRIERP